MAFYEFNFDEVIEPTIAEADKEYEIRVIDVREGIDKNGDPYIMPRFEICDVVGAKDFTQYYPIPSNNMSPKRRNESMYKIKQLLDAFDIDTSRGFNPEELIGKKTLAILGVGKDDPTYGRQNYIKMFLPF